MPGVRVGRPRAADPDGKADPAGGLDEHPFIDGAKSRYASNGRQPYLVEQPFAGSLQRYPDRQQRAAIW